MRVRDRLGKHDLVRIDGRRMPNVFPQNYWFFPPNLASVAVGNLMRLRRHRPNFTPLARARASPPLTRSRMIPRSNSAKTPSNIALPAEVVVSSPCCLLYTHEARVPAKHDGTVAQTGT